MHRNRLRRFTFGALAALVMLLATLSFGAAGSPAPSAASLAWQDDFDAPMLDARWSWPREDPTHWSLTALPGFLRITTQKGGFWGATNHVRNVLLQEAPAGDFDLQTRALFTPTDNIQAAGITVYQKVLLPFVARPEAPPAYPYRLIPESVTCAPNAGVSYYNGVVRDRAGNLQNGVCVHIAFYGPRQTKCSGCGGVGDGNWGFAPFGGWPAPANTPVEIFIVACPPDMPPGGQNSDFGDLTPLSDKWLYTTTSTSMQCTGITFRQN
jgi:hypothetical protein